MPRLDTLHPPKPLGQRQQEAAGLVAALPGLTIAGLARLLAVLVAQAEQIVPYLDARLITPAPQSPTPSWARARVPSTRSSCRRPTAASRPLA